MKKNKLYTANKWNQPVFIPKGNIFWPGGDTENSMAIWDKYANKAGYNHTDDYMNSKNWLGLSKQSNPFSKANLANAFSKQGLSNVLQGAGTGLLNAGAGMLGGLAGNAIAGGYSAGAAGDIAGTVASTGLGIAGTAIGGPIGGAIGSALGSTIGGVVNRAFGTKVDEAKKKAVEEGINNNMNFVSNASSFDDIKGPESIMTDTNVAKGGWFGGGSKADRINEDLKQRMIAAKTFAERSVDNNINNLVDDQLNDALANYAAYGGFLDNINDKFGAIGYNFMGRYFNIKESQNALKNKGLGLTQTPAFMSSFAIGGDLQTNGSDFTNGLSHIDAGGSHEENPYEGVQMGVDNEGTPNLVEEGETVFNDYVYSARILADENTKKKFRLPKKKDITFADISKKLEKESSERPNDPISQNALQVQMQQLANEQERQKQEMEVQRAREAFESLSPEEQTALMQQREQEELAAQQAIAEQQAMQQPSPEEVIAQEAMMADGSEANLGNLPTEEQIANVTALGGELVRVGDLDTKVNTFSKGGRKARRMLRKYNEDWFKQMAKSLGLSDKDMEGFEFTDNPEANLAEFNRRYRNSQYDKAFETYKTGQRTVKRNELFNPNTGRYRKSDNGDVIYETQYRQAGQDWIDKDNNTLSQADYDALSDEAKKAYTQITSKVGDRLYNNGKLVENIYNGTEDDILKGYNLEEGFKWNDKDAQALSYPAEMEHSAASYLRYAPALGGLVGLLTEGSPDYSRAQDVVSTAKGLSTPPQVSPHYIGNYLTYRPLDVLFQQNMLNAQSRATDRALMNSSGPSKMAGLLANSYNSQIASGSLYRQAQEYNDALKQKVEDFNRGTNIFNAQADMQTQNSNAHLRQRAGEIGLRGITSGYGMMDAIDARRAAARNANLNNLFTSIGNIGEEAFDTDRLKWLEKTGVLGSKVYSANGGKIKKKKNKRGLTY